MDTIGKNSIETTYCFFNENDDILRYFLSMGMSISLKNIEIISKTQFINRIGYYQIALGKYKFLKIYVFPKVYQLDIKTTLEEILYDFNLYFREYLRLRKKFTLNSGNFIKSDNIIDFSFFEISDDITEFLKKKYINLLENIYFFFKSNKFIVEKNEDFFSNEVTSHINIKKNFIEINKSKIHQIAKVDIRESIYATITLNVLNDFSKFKFIFLKNDRLDIKIKSLANKLKNYLNNNFSNTRPLNNNQISKFLNSGIFSKNHKFSILKNQLLALKGWESSKDIHKLSNIESIWFSGEFMYEMKVQEAMQNQSTSTVVVAKRSREYSLVANDTVVNKNYSIPDLIIDRESTRYIIDAKWKIINDFNDLNPMDILKVHRDAIVHGDGFRSKIILVFPSINIEEEFYVNQEFKFDYDEDVRFKIVKIPLL
ncbi:hypothetical protein [Chryseobacterium sp.]|uniref:hypothetical protein n=1 Tax=Chryseobacterium sp. TaxID=1871047 RepID=UPI0028A03589|nr:hypothetical protein [Chryseobacterium sp.]